VVWEGWSRKAPPYPDLWRKADLRPQSHGTEELKGEVAAGLDSALALKADVGRADRGTGQNSASCGGLTEPLRATGVDAVICGVDDGRVLHINYYMRNIALRSYAERCLRPSLLKNCGALTRNPGRTLG
jgi:hypothetical protein